MLPSSYRDCLERIADEHDLPQSDLRVAMIAEIMAVEQELGRELPAEYAHFVTMVGCGEEFGGTARWFHFDISRPHNVIDASRRFEEECRHRFGASARKHLRAVRGFLPVYDDYEGGLYGFLPETSEYSPTVYVWNDDESELQEAAGCFPLFLDSLVSDFVDVNDYR